MTRRTRSRVRISAVERDFETGWSLITDGKRWGCIDDDTGETQWAADEAEARSNYAEHVRVNSGAP